MKYSIIIVLLLITFTSCSTIRPVENENEVQKIVIIWVPNEKLRKDEIRIDIEDKGRIDAIIARINNSKQVKATKIPFLKLVEGHYYFEIYYINGYKKLEVFGDGTYITDSNESAFFKNTEIYFFIQQFLYFEYMKKGIVIK